MSQDSRSPITLINVFEVPAAQSDGFVADWRERAAVMSRKVGFLEARLHRAVEPRTRFQVVTIVRWASLEAWRAAIEDGDYRELLNAATAAFCGYSGSYALAAELTGPAPARSGPPAAGCDKAGSR
ncbi:antibiotic biosynthesis monooxygenase family protein [Dactylosporangium sp. CA-139114]|uniref:antibiotic biosynthesis monooxygenase family protein n=1 Tax=Dactylosporangium sp. CA-139114 TaxID=3239931 RepID=UPI003D960186